MSKTTIETKSSKDGLKCDVCGAVGEGWHDELWLGFDGVYVRRVATPDEGRDIDHCFYVVTRNCYIGSLAAMPKHICPKCVTNAVKAAIAEAEEGRRKEEGEV